MRSRGKRQPVNPRPPIECEPGDSWEFQILGAPATKKNHQRIASRPDGTAFIIGGSSARGWEKTAVEQLLPQWFGKGPIAMPVNMAAVIYRERRTGDLLNYLAAVSDALEKAGIVVDDKLVTAVDRCRLDKDALNPRVVVRVTVLSAD